ncbi:hypothetical protein Glove_692g35 [Diversispora epigaea]|uniref:Uncharacterized protein n=1 Tax=Diversispora epigaea TaxID=1348612 RepID=A0A397G633_9GLOM|nr:hypothetical protein Glove_692g35 [Diversispora epigaea]
MSTSTTTLQSVTFAVGSTVMSVGELYSTNHLETNTPTTSLQPVTLALGCLLVRLIRIPTTTLQSVMFAVGSTVMSVGELYSTNHLETNTPTTSLQPVTLALGCLLVRLIRIPTTTLQSVMFAVGSTVMSVGELYSTNHLETNTPTTSLQPFTLALSCLLVKLIPTPTTTLQSVTFAVGSTVMSVGELYSMNHLETNTPTTSLQPVMLALGCLLVRLIRIPTTILQSVTFAVGSTVMSVGKLYSTNHLETNTSTTVICDPKYPPGQSTPHEMYPYIKICKFSIYFNAYLCLIG